MKKTIKRIAILFCIIAVVAASTIPAFATGGRWIKSGSRWWYRHTDASYTTNDWEKIDGKWYHFDRHGWMQKGWIKDKGKWYYLQNDGAMKTGWIFYQTDWYCLSHKSGAMLTGWVKSGKDYYYLDKNGKMVKDEWIDGYYLDYTGKWEREHGLTLTKKVVKIEVSSGGVPADAETKTTTDPKEIEEIVAFLNGLPVSNEEHEFYYGGAIWMTIYFEDGTSIVASISVHPDADLFCKGVYYETSYTELEKIFKQL